MLTKNFTIYDKDLLLFKEIENEIINMSYINKNIYEGILCSFLVTDLQNKINCYDLLVFFFPLAKHEDIALDFYNLVLHYDRDDTKKNIIYRRSIEKVLYSMLYSHTIMLLNLVECHKGNQNDYDHYEKLFTEENLTNYVNLILSTFDQKLKEKESISIINDKIYFFSLENIKDCFIDYGQIISDEKYLIYDLERLLESIISNNN